MSFVRQLDLASLLDRKSFFLFGPRATGKSRLVHDQLGDRAMLVDLLRGDLLGRLAAQPALLEAMLGDRRGPETWVVIDEVQKLPSLLDEVHRLIEARGVRFLLTGSSARKLRRGQANLLAGRAWTAELRPLTFAEIPRFDLARFLRFGGLPMVATSAEPEEELRAYVGTYLREEILAEGLVRNLPAFSRFLEVAAIENGRMINFASVASVASIPAATVREYYALLEDTLVGFVQPAWRKSRTRKAITTARAWWFDTGVTHTLSGTRTLDRNSDLWGRSFEHWVAMELRAWLSYRRRPEPLTYWRSTSQFEVDFLVGDDVAIEVKATRRVTDRDRRGLRALAEEQIVKRFYLVSEDPILHRRGTIECLPWDEFARRLWGDVLIVA
jgi:predicted AAA+ superfamily ATPase